MTLTARGTGLLIAGPALLAAGFGFGYRELTVLGCAALLAVGFGVGYAAWRPRLAVTREAQPDRVTPGGESPVTQTPPHSSRVRGPPVLPSLTRAGTTKQYPR